MVPIAVVAVIVWRSSRGRTRSYSVIPSAIVVGIMIRGIIRTPIRRIPAAMTSAIIVGIMVRGIIRMAVARILTAITSPIIVRIMIRRIIGATTASHHSAAAID
jgi:hypothetical protein